MSGHDHLPRVHMMTSSNENIFRLTGPLWGESTGHRWIPLTKAIDAELWCFLWSAPERFKIISTPVIWDTIALVMTSVWWFLSRMSNRNLIFTVLYLLMSPWWPHEMEILSAVVVLCEGNHLSPGSNIAICAMQVSPPCELFRKHQNILAFDKIFRQLHGTGSKNPKG